MLGKVTLDMDAVVFLGLDSTSIRVLLHMAALCKDGEVVDVDKLCWVTGYSISTIFITLDKLVEADLAFVCGWLDMSTPMHALRIGQIARRVTPQKTPSKTATTPAPVVSLATGKPLAPVSSSGGDTRN